MRNRSFGLVISCSILLAYTAYANDENSTNSSFENFQQIQLLIRDGYCPEAKQKKIQKELAEILANDQADRTTSNPEMSSNDLARRVRVASIAAESCLKDKEDYLAAALVFQHGGLPEHYMRAILYANKSAELGDLTAVSLRLAAIDRYLMSLGYKQVFGSQFSAPAYYKIVESEKDTVTCLWPIEDKIDFVKDLNFGSAEYRSYLQEDVTARQRQTPECSFPARDPLPLLPALLNTKI